MAECWTIRRSDSCEYRADDEGSPDLPSFTTIAWRVWHLVGCYAGERLPRWLGVKLQPKGEAPPVPATAREAIAVLGRAYAFWQELLQAIPVDAWSEPLGAITGLYAESAKAGLVLHQLDEQIHHGAELGVLRDLYRAARPGFSTGRFLP